MARNYKQEYAEYQGTPAQIKNREARNKARRMLESEGKVHKGDGMDVNHIDPISKGGKTVKGNLNVETKHNNRSYKRTSSGGVK